ncbi:MAG: cupin domain-containing protein [Candidatus Sungiibacteriota bacterium]|uniref:Cupin domain-containing protein n=1 Tax=Candidatus Sungiibacteriota bacterium TaxID=2750080 RepID=A0A7T5RJK4_9BACT|nr:MAG: cupin domain-containing protein [Candidatus Sungbacteria bacterium]
MAHVLMNPKAWSLLHEHHRVDEAYIITHGSGHLIRGDTVFAVQAGDVLWIPRHTRHKLINTSATSLEHLVLAAPPFDSADVYLDESWGDPKATPQPFVQPPVDDCFDGARIIAYELTGVASIAFGWVMADPTRHKPAHYNKDITEWICVVEGGGFIEVDGVSYPIRRGDWIRIDPDEKHALRNRNDQHMIVVCICTPCFKMEDVHYK